MNKLLLKLVWLVFLLTSTQILYAQGELWGLTSNGGSDQLGAIFSTSANGTNFVLRKNFTSQYPGSAPSRYRLVETSNGNLYGVTMAGGLEGKGVLFSYNQSSGVYRRIIDFTSAIGSYPFGLTLASNGKIYGLVNSGNVNNNGMLFEYDPFNDSFNIRVIFGSTTIGGFPSGTLLEAVSGKLYGTTITSGSGGMSGGILFEFDLTTGVIQSKFDFNTIGALSPTGELVKANDGYIYGMTAYGGANNLGIIFKFDPATGNCSKSIDFTATY